ncbi:hypothetical protein FA13DRAFT_1784069, partial [Coprinellus micaceus]
MVAGSLHHVEFGCLLFFFSPGSTHLGVSPVPQRQPAAFVTVQPGYSPSPRLIHKGTGEESAGDGEGGEQLPELELNSVQNRRPGFTELKPKDEDIVDRVEERPSAPTSSSASRHPSPSRSAKAGAIPPPPSTLKLARSSSTTTRSFTTSARSSGAVPSTTALAILAGLQQAHREASQGIAIDPTPQHYLSRRKERSGDRRIYEEKGGDTHPGRTVDKSRGSGSLPDRVTEGDAQGPSATAPIPVADWTRSSSIGSIQGLLNTAFDYITTVAPSRSISTPTPPVATIEDGETHLNGYLAPVPTTSNLPSPLKSRADSRPSPQNPFPLPPPSSSTSSSPPLARTSRPNPNQSDLEAVLQGQQRSGATVHRSRTVTSGPGKEVAEVVRERERCHAQGQWKGIQASRESDKERERDRSRTRQETYPPTRAISPDFYSQANSTFNSAASDPYAVARLEDRCRHLEKGSGTYKPSGAARKGVGHQGWDNELREKDSQLRQRDGELRGGRGVERGGEEEVRWRDEELERMKEKERQWEKERVVLQRKPSMKELVNRTKENVEKLENQLKRRATASPVVTAGKTAAARENVARWMLTVTGTLGVPE